MNLLKKLFKKNFFEQENNFEQSFNKSSIWIYTEDMQQPAVREEKDYVKIGYFDGTKYFYNIVTGESFPIQSNKDMVIDGRCFKTIFCYCEKGICYLSQNRAKGYSPLNGSFIATEDGTVVKLKSTFEFMKKLGHHIVTIDELKKIHEELNAYAHFCTQVELNVYKGC